MRLLADKLSEEQAKELTSWHYPEEYSIYNLPSWEIIVQKNYSLADSIKREKYIGTIEILGKVATSIMEKKLGKLLE